MKIFEPVRKGLLPQEVERQLRAAILSGVYRPGDKLPSEQELVGQFQVSRTTVREALRNLQNDGLIVIKRGVSGGSYVSELQSDPIARSFQNLFDMGRVDFSHLIEARLFVEPAVAASAAVHRTPKDLDNLDRLLSGAEALIDESWKDARMTNVRFHCEVAKVIANPITVFFCESVMHVFSHMLFALTQERVNASGIKKLVGQHRYILDAIVNQDPEEACARAKAHLLETFHMYARIIPERGDSGVEERLRSYDGERPTKER